MGFFLVFRDPDRPPAEGIVSPADGKIMAIENDVTVEFPNSKHKPSKSKGTEKYIKMCIFMNVHNVHVNRMPMDGTITYVQHFQGPLISAYKKESEKNERVVIQADTEIGPIQIIQIAGLVARRIVPYVKPGASRVRDTEAGPSARRPRDPSFRSQVRRYQLRLRSVRSGSDPPTCHGPIRRRVTPEVPTDGASGGA